MKLLSVHKRVTIPWIRRPVHPVPDLVSKINLIS